MKNCKEYSGQIIFYDDLNNVERQELKNHLRECESCRNDSKQFQSILSVLKSGSAEVHITHDAMVRFILFQKNPDEPDYDGTRLSARQARQIRDHLQTCQACTLRFETMNLEYESLNSYINELDLPDYELGKTGAEHRLRRFIPAAIESLANTWKKLSSIPKPGYALIPAASLAILLALIIILPFFQKGGDSYLNLARLEDKTISYLTRTTNIDYLQQGISEFNNGNYAEAISLFEQTLEMTSDDLDRAFAEYVCGLAYLYQMNDRLNDLQSDDYEQIDRGIGHFQNSLSFESTSRIREETHWYLGKAYLMKGDFREATISFEKAKSFKGTKYQDAQNILKEIERNLISTK